MASHKPRADSQSLQINTANMPEAAQWHETVERLHRLTLMGLGTDVTSVKVDLASSTASPAATSDIKCRLTVRLKRSRSAVNVETRHPDGALAVMQAFTRAQREAQRQLDLGRRAARQHYLAGIGD